MSGPSTDGRIDFYPVRHHSPACALALLRGLEEAQPAQVLVEAPADFEPLLPLLTDAAITPPVAIVSMAPRPERDGVARAVSTYPFCVHSPEYVALSWAARTGAAARLIDLPVGHEGMRGHRRRRDAPEQLIWDERLDHNAYVQALCARRGVADGPALWDALFETKAGTADWRGFFAAVSTYCEHIRAVTPQAEMAEDGTLAREAQMAACLGAALAGEGRIAVITGGFHTPPLRAAALAGGKAVALAKAPPQEAYLIRYGFQQLDSGSGYGAGLPHPAWYDRLWTSLAAGAPAADLAEAVMVDFADHLRRTAPQLALATPTLATAVLAASRLAMLRDLPWPGRNEVLDAVRSTAVKDALEAGGAPVLQALDAFLVGDRIGDLPSGFPQPPIVEAVRSEARALGFSLDSAAPRQRELDVLRKPRHGRASRLMHALALVDAGFGRRISGPDLMSGWRADMLFEVWSYAWSPMVEHRLILRAADGDTLEALCAAELVRRRDALVDQGLARSASAHVTLLADAVLSGFEGLTIRVLDWCGVAVAEDSDVVSIIAALGGAARLAAAAEQGAGPLAGRAEAFALLRRQGFERLLMLFPHVAQTPADKLPALARALADLAGLAAEDGLGFAGLAEVVREVLRGALPPSLFGALTAFAGLTGALEEPAVVAALEAALDGTYLKASDRVAALTGCLTVAPRLIVNSTALLGASDRFLAAVDNDTFLALLPELRFAFSQLTPAEVDAVAGWVGQAHGVSPRGLTTADIPAAETEENLRFADRLAAGWRADGLGAWLLDEARA